MLLVGSDGFGIRIELGPLVRRPLVGQMVLELAAVRGEQEPDGGPGGTDVARSEHVDQVRHGTTLPGQASVHGVMPSDMITYPPVQLEVEGDDQRSGPAGHAHRRILSLACRCSCGLRLYAHRTP